MQVKTHVITAISVSSLILLGMKHFDLMLLDVRHYLIIIFVVAIGSLFPDIDEPGSYIGRRTPIVSHIIKLIFGHRGMTHSLIILPIIAFLCFVPTFAFDEVPIIFLYIIAAFILGWVLHIYGDMHTRGGVPIFLPFSKKNYHILPRGLQFYTGSIQEFVVFYAFYFMLFCVCFYFYFLQDVGFVQ